MSRKCCGNVGLVNGLFGLGVLSLLGSFYYQNSATPEFAMTLCVGSAVLFGVSWLMANSNHKAEISRRENDETVEALYREIDNVRNDLVKKCDEEVSGIHHRMDYERNCSGKVCKKEILNEG